MKYLFAGILFVFFSINSIAQNTNNTETNRVSGTGKKGNVTFKGSAFGDPARSGSNETSKESAFPESPSTEGAGKSRGLLKKSDEKETMEMPVDTILKDTLFLIDPQNHEIKHTE